MGLASNQYFLPITRELLQAPAVSSQELFKRAGASKTPAYRTLRFYEFHGALQSGRTIQIDARSILHLQGGLRADRALPDRSVPKGPPLDHALTLLDEVGIPAAVGFQTAANRHAYFEPSGAHQLYIQRPEKAAQAIATTRKVSDAFEQAPDASSQDRYRLYVDDLERLDVQAGPITSPVQTLLDLCLHSHAAAHKEFLFDQLQKQGALHA